MKKTHKRVGKAYRIEKENLNDLWNRSISKEMTDVRVVFKLLEGSDKVPIGCSFFSVA